MREKLNRFAKMLASTGMGFTKTYRNSSYGDA